jgi:hypothetical protein
MGTRTTREEDYFYTAQALTSMLQHTLAAVVGEGAIVEDGIASCVKACLTMVQVGV